MAILGTFVFPHPPLMIPEVGKGQETVIQKTVDACHKAAKMVASFEPETIIVISPHSTMYLDYFHVSPGRQGRGDFGNFNGKEVSITAAYDTEFVSALEKNTAIKNIPAGTLGEIEPDLDHGTMIPLYFINQYYKEYKIVRIGLSGLSPAEHYKFGQSIKETIEQLNRKSIIVASGDLSHKLLAEGPYGFSKEGKEFDQQVTKIMEHGDFIKFLEFEPEFLEEAAECGLKSFQIMAGTLDKIEVESNFLSYEGPFGVGYGVASFLPIRENEKRDFLRQYLEKEERRMKNQREQESEYVRLARYTLEHYIKVGELPKSPKWLTKESSTKQAGVFVSLKKNGELRGCIGTILPVQDNIKEEIMANAISAGTKDPRFPPVREEELKELIYSVDVLTKPEPVKSERELDAKKYGVIVTCGEKRGLLLPDLAGVDTVKQQVQIAKQKAGILESEKVSYARFKVVRYS